MELLLLLTLPIASVCGGGAYMKCYKEEKLNKKGTFKTTEGYTVLYLDNNNLSGDSEYFEVTVVNGVFIYDDLMYYSLKNEVFGDEINDGIIWLGSSKESEKTIKTNLHNGIYEKCTASYEIPRKKGFKYLYIYPPFFQGEYLTVKHTQKKGISKSLIIILVVISGILFCLILTIIMFCIKSKMRRRNIIDYSLYGPNSKMANINYSNNPPMPIYPPPPPSAYPIQQIPPSDSNNMVKVYCNIKN